MMEFVNGFRIIPYIMENNPAMFETTNQVPTGKRSHNELENHHAIHGKSTIS
jgi:hypothetical protein